jgi:hypothetical protein
MKFNIDYDQILKNRILQGTKKHCWKGGGDQKSHHSGLILPSISFIWVPRSKAEIQHIQKSWIRHWIKKNKGRNEIS